MKRLSRYCKLDIIELPDEKTPENAGEQLNLAIKAKEGDRILSSLKDDAYVIALAIEGKMLDSVEFSQKIEKLGIDSVSHIILIRISLQPQRICHPEERTLQVLLQVLRP